jgi:putative PIN family toxin of toxin-antitoxin system
VSHAVVDTNVIVSGALRERSIPGRILDAARSREFDLTVSSALVDELSRVLARPKISGRLGWSPQDRDLFVLGLADFATFVAPSFELDMIPRDPSDNRVLEAAVEGEADYIVSGDHHLLELREYEGISIVTPTQFLAVLAAQ